MLEGSLHRKQTVHMPIEVEKYVEPTVIRIYEPILIRNSRRALTFGLIGLLIGLLLGVISAHAQTSGGINSGTSTSNLSRLGPFWGTDSGSSTAYVVTSTQTQTLQNGLTVCFLAANNSSTTTPTLNWNSTGVKNITYLGNNVFYGTEIQTTTPNCMTYNGTNWVMMTSAQPNAYYLKGVLVPSSPTAGCVWNALNPTNYQCTSTSLGITSILPGVIYSAAGTAIPACNAGATGLNATVSDALTPTFLGTYTSGGTGFTKVLCNGTSWLID